MPGKAFFVDRDGVLNEMVYDETHGLMDSPRTPAQVRMRKGAGRFLREIKALGYFVVVVTNQPGVAKGTLTIAGLEAVNAHLSGLLQEDGATWDALYACPHHPTGERPGAGNPFVMDCACRKPKPGLLLQAAREHSLELAASWMLGDGIVDIQAGLAAGCRTILLSKLKLDLLEKYVDLVRQPPEHVAPDFEAALRIVRASQVSA